MDLPNCSPGRIRGAVTLVRSLALIESYLRLERTQHSLRCQRSWWHGHIGEDLGFRNVVIRIVRVSEAGSAVNDSDQSLY